MAEENPLIKFYRENNISPVHQSLDDFKAHLLRREKLYRSLGLPPIVFAERTILEIGPGGGHNALALFSWGGRVDFVEPNPRAQAEIPVLMKQYGINKSHWKLFTGPIEAYPLEKCYDLVIAEGVIPGMNNRAEVLGRIADLIKPGGVVVVTCVDEISYFFEVLKRLVACRLTDGLENLNDKVQVLVQAFASHLQKLNYATRPVEDWVTDQLLNPALHGELFSMADCIREFGSGFELLGSSPDLFTDLSWYKDIHSPDSARKLEQFERKRHVLMLWNMPESERTAALNAQLFQACAELRKLLGTYEKQASPQIMSLIINQLEAVLELSSDLDPRINKAIREVIKLLEDKELNTEKVARSDDFAAAFGRGQQYVSMVKK